MLDNLVDISYLKSLLGYTYKDECSVLNYLISLYQNTESYYRSLALGLSTFEFMTSSDVYSLIGLERVEYNENLDFIKLYGNTDILIYFPHMMDRFRVEELYSLDGSLSLYIHYQAVIDSLGNQNLSILKKNYHLSDDSFGPLNLSHGLDLNYLYELNINHIFSRGVLLEFYKMNQHLISMKSYVYDYDVLSRYLNLFNDLLYNVNYSLDKVLESSSLNPFMNQELSLYIDIYSDLSSFYDNDIESFLLLKSYFKIVVLNLDLDGYSSDLTKLVTWLSKLKENGLNIILKGDELVGRSNISSNSQSLFDLMLRGDV